MKLVLDSSVVFKLFREEKGSLEAMVLFADAGENDVQLLCPRLIFYEIGNAVWKLSRQGRYENQGLMGKMFDLLIDYVPMTPERAENAMSIARDMDLTYYDAAFIALAEENQCRLVTDDRAIIKRFDKAVDIKAAVGMIRGDPDH